MASRLRPRPPLDGIDPAEEQRVSEAIASLRTLRSDSSTTQADIDARIETARAIIASINTTSLMTWPDRYDDQIFVITELQNLAYHEVDGGGIQDIAQWCIRQYLQVINQSRDDCIAALSGTDYPYGPEALLTSISSGLGHAWLLRAQSTLARIHRLEGSSSSGSSSQRPPSSAGRMSFTSSDDARENARAVLEADARAGTSDYVEARGMLLPSTEYFQRAIAEAEQNERVTGELLSLVCQRESRR